jgi:tripartite ATP-independent transporter DctP family solute receptor
MHNPAMHVRGARVIAHRAPRSDRPNREDRNMRNSPSALLALIMFGGLVGAASAQDTYTLKIACVLDSQHPILVGARRMAELAEKDSGGRLKLNLYPSSQLGGQREVLQNVQAGVVDGVIEATATLTNFVPQLGVVDLPYLAKDESAAFRLFDGPVFEQELGPPAAAAGFHIVQVWEVTFRNVYTRSRPINSVADLKGQKIRVIPSPSYIALFRALGAAPTPMAFGEVYTALQQGVIDGAENDTVTYQTTKHMEVARNLALTGHMMLANTLYISERVWQRLPDDLKAVIRQASLEARNTVTAERATRNAKALDDIRAAGINVTQPDLAPFTAVGQQTYKELAERLGPDLVGRIVEATK